MRRLLNIGIAFAVVWLARMTEEFLTATGWGGLFTIVFGWVVIFFLSLVYVAAAVLVGQLLRLPVITEAWSCAGCWTLLLAIPPLLVLILSRSLGLRTIDPVSNYSLMDFWLNSLCYFLIAFPIANLPTRRSPSLKP
jgi:hypothetical protein